MFKNKYGKVRSGWKIAAITAVILGIIMIISIIIGIIMVVILLSRGDLNLATMELSAAGKKLVNDLNPIIMFFSELIMIFTPIIAWKFVMKRPLREMGLGPLNIHYKELLTGLLFGIVSISLVFLCILLSGNAHVKSWTPNFTIDTVIYLAIFISVGFAEEIYGRGFIMSVLKQTRNIPVILIVSSVIFSLLHSLNSGIGIIPYINIFLVGTLFAYIYIKSGSIWMSIGYHITWNYFQGNVFGFKVSGMNTNGIFSTVYTKNNMFNGGAFGPEGGLFVTAVILVGFLFVHLYYKNKQFYFLSEEPKEENSNIIEEISQ